MTVRIGGASSMAARAFGIERLAPADEPGAQTLKRGEFRLGFGARDRGDGSRALAAAGEAGQGLDRRARRAEAAQHREEADGADRLGAAQPQPVQALLRVEFARGQGCVSALCEGDPALRAGDQAPDIFMVPQDD